MEFFKPDVSNALQPDATDGTNAKPHTPEWFAIQTDGFRLYFILLNLVIFTRRLGGQELGGGLRGESAVQAHHHVSGVQTLRPRDPDLGAGRGGGGGEGGWEPTVTTKHRRCFQAKSSQSP